jgi:carbamoyltransferase
MRGEPIVCTTVDAINCFVRCQIDVLVVEDCTLERSGIPPMWDFQAQQGLAGRPKDGEVGHLVYTLL